MDNALPFILKNPIYDIPAHPKVSAQELINNLKIQIEPFKPEIVLNQKVEKIVDHSDSFSVFTSNKTQIEAKCIFIAAGNGAFGPNRPPLENIYEFENKTVFYNINNKMLFKDKVVAIAGGGDSAVDWAIELSKVASKIFFIHRRDKLRAMPANVKILEKLRDKGIIEMIIPYQLDSILGKNGIIESLIVKNLDKIEKKLMLIFFYHFLGFLQILVL